MVACRGLVAPFSSKILFLILELPYPEAYPIAFDKVHFHRLTMRSLIRYEIFGIGTCLPYSHLISRFPRF